MRLTDKQRKYLHTIRFRILLSTISLVILVSAVIACISYFIVSENLQKNMIQTSETRLTFLCTSIDSNVHNVKNFIHTCQNSSKVRYFTREEDGNNAVKREAREAIMEAYTGSTALPSQLIRLVVLKNEGRDIIQVVESPYSTSAISADAIRSLSYYELLHGNPEQFVTDIMEDPFLPTKTVQMLPLLHGIQHPYKADESGYIYTELSASVITDPINSLYPESGSRFLFQINDKQYLCEGRHLIPVLDSFTLLEDISDMSLSEDTVIQKVVSTEDGQTFITVTRPLDIKNCYVTECLDTRLLETGITRTFFLITLVIITAASAIGVFLSLFLNRTVNVPVKKLQERMTRISDGDFSRDTSTEWAHELGDIGKNINDLSENVLSLMNQRIEDERQKKDYEYKMLQSQINPHFLYNTLNSIKWMATIQNAPGIAEMTTSLSKLLKDISKGTTTLITLEHELSLIRDYFTIQQYRYGGAVTLEIDVRDEALLSCRILKFTLQPIVENAIFHGIEPKGSSGRITIRIYQDEARDVHVDVTDDGIGMAPEMASSILSASAPTGSSFFKEIGISNVHKRLQYEFGSRYGLTITSCPGEFTTVSILLPPKDASFPPP